MSSILYVVSPYLRVIDKDYYYFSVTSILLFILQEEDDNCLYLSRRIQQVQRQILIGVKL